MYKKYKPEGSLMDLPPDFRSFMRILLFFRFLGVGFCMTCWMIRIFNSRSSRSISRDASSCSRFFNSSSWIFCCSAAFVSSSSLHRSSCLYETNTVLYIILKWNIRSYPDDLSFSGTNYFSRENLSLSQMTLKKLWLIASTFYWYPLEYWCLFSLFALCTIFFF